MKHELCRNPDELKIIIKTALSTTSTASYRELHRVVGVAGAGAPLLCCAGCAAQRPLPQPLLLLLLLLLGAGWCWLREGVCKRLGGKKSLCTHSGTCACTRMRTHAHTHMHMHAHTTTTTTTMNAV